MHRQLGLYPQGLGLNIMRSISLVKNLNIIIITTIVIIIIVDC